MTPIIKPRIRIYRQENHFPLELESLGNQVLSIEEV